MPLTICVHFPKLKIEFLHMPRRWTHVSICLRLHRWQRLEAQGSLHTRDWEPVTITLQALSLVEKASRSKFAAHYAWGTNKACKCKMDVKSTWNSYMASNVSCFMVTWIVFKNHLLEVGRTQNWETMTLWMLAIAYLFYFIMCEDLYE